MKTIVVATDFSENAFVAAEYAGRLAAFYGADLWLFHAYQIPIAVGEFAFASLDIASMQHSTELELKNLKQRLTASLEYKSTIYVFGCIGELQMELNKFCDSKKADLVVFGLSGKNKLIKLMVGSNTIVSIHELKYPLLIVPPGSVFYPVKKIGFACDFKEIKKTLPIDLLKKLVDDFKAELYILNVDMNNRNFDADSLHERFELSQLLGKTQAEYKNIEADNVTDGVNWFVEKGSIDLLVVIPKKHSVLRKLFLRSHSKDLIFHTKVPVVCMHQ